MFVGSWKGSPTPEFGGKTTLLLTARPDAERQNVGLQSKVATVRLASMMPSILYFPRVETSDDLGHCEWGLICYLLKTRDKRQNFKAKMAIAYGGWVECTILGSAQPNRVPISDTGICISATHTGLSQGNHSCNRSLFWSATYCPFRREILLNLWVNYPFKPKGSLDNHVGNAVFKPDTDYGYCNPPPPYLSG